jgi:hypothetical protein
MRGPSTRKELFSLFGSIDSLVTTWRLYRAELLKMAGMGRRPRGFWATRLSA